MKIKLKREDWVQKLNKKDLLRLYSYHLRNALLVLLMIIFVRQKLVYLALLVIGFSELRWLIDIVRSIEEK